MANEIQNIIDELNGSREKFAHGLAANSLALIKLRIQNKGIGSDGSKIGGGSYSEAKVPYWFLSEDEKVQEKLKKKSTDNYHASYKDLRTVKGFPTSYVNLTFTGGMFKYTGVTTGVTTSTSTTMIIGGKNERSKKLIAVNSWRFGNILSMTDDEEKLVKQAQIDRVENIIKKHWK